MTPRLKIFLVSLFISLPFFWGVNVLGGELKNFFFFQAINYDPNLLLAQVASTPINNFGPMRNNQISNLEINAKSATSILIDENGDEKILFQKDINEKLAIASLTKLMTALVVLENYDLNKEMTVSQAAVDQEGDLGQLKAGKTFPVNYLLYPLLMESSNDAAFSLANDYEGMNEEKFVEMMNVTAKKLGLNNTFFVNSTGLDPKESTSTANYSTAKDLTKLTKELLKEPLVWEILSTPRYQVYGPELFNINELLSEPNGWRDKIIGGKTGYTERAGGCMILVLKAPNNDNLKIINVILGAGEGENRFDEMRTLTNWIYNAYQW